MLTLKTPIGSRSRNDAIDQAQKALVDIGEPAVEALIAAMEEDLEDYPMRYVIAPLGEIGDPRAVEALLKAVGDPSAAVRSAAVEALGEIRDPRVFEPVVNALGDSDKSVRFYAAMGLGQIGDARAGDALVTALKDPDESVRSWAADSLGVLKDRKAVKALIGVSVEDQAEKVRTAALKALSEIDPEWAQDELAQQQAVSVELEGTALYELLHSGEIYSIALAGTQAKLDYRRGSFGERDGWFLVAPTGLPGLPERRIAIDPDQDPDRVVHQWLEEIPQRQVGLKPEGKIFPLIQSRPDVSYDNPIVIGNLAYLVEDTGGKAWHLRIGVSRDAEQDLVVPASALLSSEAVDSWVLDTIAAVGLSLPR